MLRVTIRSMLSFVVVLLLVLPAGAAPLGLPLLDVAVQDLTAVTVTSTTTDDQGYFSLPALAADDYLLVISDPVSDLEYRQNFTVPAELAPALLHGRVTSDGEVAISFEVTAALFDEAGLPDPEEFAVTLKFKWNGNSNRSNGKLWVFVRGSDVSVIENIILSSDQGSLEATAVRVNDEQTKLMADFSKRAAYQALIPPDAARGDTVDVTISVVTPTGTQEEIVPVRILGKK